MFTKNALGNQSHSIIEPIKTMALIEVMGEGVMTLIGEQERNEQGKIGPVKWVILTPGIEGKKCQTPDIENLPRHSTPILKSVLIMKDTAIIPSRHTTHDFHTDIRHCKIFDLDI